jgi:hypothetical protein
MEGEILSPFVMTHAPLRFTEVSLNGTPRCLDQYTPWVRRSSQLQDAVERNELVQVEGVVLWDLTPDDERRSPETGLTRPANSVKTRVICLQLGHDTIRVIAKSTSTEVLRLDRARTALVLLHKVRIIRDEWPLVYNSCFSLPHFTICFDDKSSVCTHGTKTICHPWRVDEHDRHAPNVASRSEREIQHGQRVALRIPTIPIIVCGDQQPSTDLLENFDVTLNNIRATTNYRIMTLWGPATLKVAQVSSAMDGLTDTCIYELHDVTVCFSTYDEERSHHDKELTVQTSVYSHVEPVDARETNDFIAKTTQAMHDIGHGLRKPVCLQTMTCLTPCRYMQPAETTQSD